jgi:hypothetical protein
MEDAVGIAGNVEVERCTACSAALGAPSLSRGSVAEGWVDDGAVTAAAFDGSGGASDFGRWNPTTSTEAAVPATNHPTHAGRRGRFNDSMALDSRTPSGAPTAAAR